MNLALSAILLIILLLPGAIAIRAYYTSVKEKKSSIAIPLNDLLIKGIAISFIFHSLAIFLIHLFNTEVELDVLYKITSGKDITISDKEISKYFLQFIWYNITVMGMA